MRFPQKAVVAILLVFAIASEATAASFTDVQGTGFEDAFAYLSTEGIVQGYSSGEGKPYAPLNRAEAIKVIISAHPEFQSRVDWYMNHMPPLSLFVDVNQDQWYAPYLETAFEKNIVRGYDDGTFRAGRLLSTEEAVVLLMRSFNESSDQFQQSSRIENNPNQWYTPAVNGAIERNLLPRQTQLRLGTAITRGEFFEIAYRLHSIQKSGAVAFVESVNQQPIAQAQPVIIASNSNQAVRPQQRSSINAGQPAVVSVGSSSNTGVNDVSRSPYASEKYFSITIPKAGITDLTISHPSDPFTKEGVLAPLQQGVGHLFSYPGNGGKIMVYGHSSGYPWDVSQYTKIFRKINELKAGDRIYVTYDGKLYEYEVTYEEAVAASDTSRFEDNGTGESLILYTCWPPDSITQRYLIHAVPVSTIALR